MMSPMSSGLVSRTYNLKKDKDIGDIGDVSSPPHKNYKLYHLTLGFNTESIDQTTYCAKKLLKETITNRKVAEIITSFNWESILRQDRNDVSPSSAACSDLSTV